MPHKEYKKIDIDSLHDQIWAVVREYCVNSGIDINDYKMRSTLKHNTIINLMNYIYINLFKPKNTALYGQCKSLLDYNNIDELAAVSNIFIDICSYFNVSQGLYAFEIMTGIDDNTISDWLSHNDELNIKRAGVIKAVRNYNKNALISILKDSGVGAIAVANNDVETGLEWTKNTQQIAQNNTVYYIPSERIDKLRLDKPPET